MKIEKIEPVFKEVEKSSKILFKEILSSESKMKQKYLLIFSTIFLLVSTSTVKILGIEIIGTKSEINIDNYLAITSIFIILYLLVSFLRKVFQDIFGNEFSRTIGFIYLSNISQNIMTEMNNKFNKMLGNQKESDKISKKIDEKLEKINQISKEYINKRNDLQKRADSETEYKRKNQIMEKLLLTFDEERKETQKFKIEEEDFRDEFYEENKELEKEISVLSNQIAYTKKCHDKGKRSFEFMKVFEIWVPALYSLGILIILIVWTVNFSN